MKARKNRWNLLIFVATGLVIVALLSLTSSAWATPSQTPGRQTATVPPLKGSDKTAVSPGEHMVFEITFNVPIGVSWSSVVVTDDIDPYLIIDYVTCTPATPNCTVVGQTVTVTYASLSGGTSVSIRIYCTVRGTAPVGYEIVNTASLSAGGQDPLFSDPTVTVVEEESVPEAGSLFLLASGLAGLAGYAVMRWGVRRP